MVAFLTVSMFLVALEIGLGKPESFRITYTGVPELLQSGYNSAANLSVKPSIELAATKNVDKANHLISFQPFEVFKKVVQPPSSHSEYIPTGFAQLTIDVDEINTKPAYLVPSSLGDPLVPYLIPSNTPSLPSLAQFSPSSNHPPKKASHVSRHHSGERIRSLGINKNTQQDVDYDFQVFEAVPTNNVNDF